MSQFFTSGGQSIRASASASVLSMNIQDWFPLGWTGWFSLLSKGLSRIFSNTTVQKHQFFGAQLSLWSNSLRWKWSRSAVWLFATPWTVAYQDPQSMGFSRQGYWSGLPLVNSKTGIHSCFSNSRLQSFSLHPAGPHWVILSLPRNSWNQCWKCKEVANILQNFLSNRGVQEYSTPEYGTLAYWIS